MNKGIFVFYRMRPSPRAPVNCGCIEVESSRGCRHHHRHHHRHHRRRHRRRFLRRRLSCTPLTGPRLTLRSVSPSNCLEEVIQSATLNPLCCPNSYLSELQPEAAVPDFH